MTEATEYSLTRTRLLEGVWEGVVKANERVLPMPEIAVTLRDRHIPGVTLAPLPDGDGWQLRVPIPVDTIADGVHTFLISDDRNDVVLDSFTLIAGEALAEDIRAEMELLRAELDMLKRAFRRHCLETA